MREILLDSQITEHFTFREMLTSSTAIRLGLSNIPDDNEIYKNLQWLCEALELIRAGLGKPIRIVSGYRDEAVNTAVGGSKNSAHCKGLAADFTVKGTSLLEVCKAIPAWVKDFDQIIYEFGEAGWVHLGLSVKPRRQLLSAVKEGGKTVYKEGL